MTSISAAAPAAPRGALHLGLWVVQGLLAFAFLAAGAMKATQPLDALLDGGMSFVAYTPTALVRFIGVSEVLGAFGLILPAALRIQPKLTPLAAALLALVMALAASTHVVNGEPEALPANLVLGGLALFVAWGRTVKAPISAR